MSNGSVTDRWRRPHREGGKRVLMVKQTNRTERGLNLSKSRHKTSQCVQYPVLIKSYTKDLCFPIFELVIQSRLSTPFTERKCRNNVMILAKKAIVIHDNIRETCVSSHIQHRFGLRGVQALS